MSNKTRRDRRKLLSERKALKAMRRRDRQSLLESRLAPSPSPTPRRTPAERLDALLSGGRPGTDPVTLQLQHLTRGHTSAHPRMVRLRALLEATHRRLPELMAGGGLSLLWRLTDESWVRPLEEWKPRGRITTTRLRSLLRHLLLRFSAPNFLLGELSAVSELTESDLADRLALLVSLGRGDSPRSAQRDGLLPACLTKRMLHQTLQTPAATLVHAVRRTQVAAFGGSSALSAQVCASFLGHSLQADGAFWQGIIQWLCRQHMLDPGQVHPMLDYIRNRRGLATADDRPAWSIKGRTADSLIRDMEAWHARLRQIRQVREESLPASGFIGGRFELKARDGMMIWEVTEIRCEKALAAEGRALRHCVFSYRQAIKQGRSSIWSVSCNGERVLTVEVLNRWGNIVQVRGRRNRRPTHSERGILARWAAVARLTLKSSAV